MLFLIFSILNSNNLSVEKTACQQVKIKYCIKILFRMITFPIKWWLIYFLSISHTMTVCTVQMPDSGTKCYDLLCVSIYYHSWSHFAWDYLCHISLNISQTHHIIKHICRSISYNLSFFVLIVVIKVKWKGSTPESHNNCKIIILSVGSL